MGLGSFVGLLGLWALLVLALQRLFSTLRTRVAGIVCVRPIFHLRASSNRCTPYLASPLNWSEAVQGGHVPAGGISYQAGDSFVIVVMVRRESEGNQSYSSLPSS